MHLLMVIRKLYLQLIPMSQADKENHEKKMKEGQPSSEEEKPTVDDQKPAAPAFSILGILKRVWALLTQKERRRAGCFSLGSSSTALWTSSDWPRSCPSLDW